MNTCSVAISGIPASVSGMNMYLLGDTFLRHFYTSFNYATNEIELSLNSQYITDGYTSSFLNVDLNKLAKVSMPDGSFFAQIKTIPDVSKQGSAAIKLYIALSVTVGLTIIGLIALYFYKRGQMKKRALSKDMRDIKGRAAIGFEESEQKLVQ